MSNIAALDFMPEGSPVVQIIPTAQPDDVLVEAQRKLIWLKDSMVVMSEHQTLIKFAPEWSSMFLSWAQAAHEASIMIDFVNDGSLRKIANSQHSSRAQAVCAGGDHE